MAYELKTKDPGFQPTHYGRRRYLYEEGDLPGLGGDRFVSPILFVDAHVASYDFTKTLKADPQYCNEPTKDWVWYKPGPGP
jgi:hypothetical protein